jgi:GDPmannose 4,6-dehydratase
MSLPDSINNCAASGFSITKPETVDALVGSVKPCQIYYLAAHHTSSEAMEDDSSLTEYNRYHEVHVVGLLNFLCAIRNHAPQCRLFFAASSLIFGSPREPIQNEETPFNPYGFYGLTKAQGVHLCREFRRRHGIFASSGILYNHESSLRGNKFLSKKLIEAAHLISLGRQKSLSVGSLSAEVDWGYAPDFVEAFQLILTANAPDDFIVATGESHTVSEFADIVFKRFGLSAERYVSENSAMLGRNAPRRVGNYSKLRKTTGWQPKFDFPTFVNTLVSDYLSGLDQGLSI